MTDSKVETMEDERLRDEIRRRAPRPSAAHDAAILDAARAKAARTRRDRMVERNRTWSGIGIAAALVLAIGVWQSAPQLPGDGGIRGGAAAVVPVDNATLGGAPQTFAWPAEAGATRYKVKLHDDTATLIWESAWIEATSTDLPAGVPVDSGARYFWVVDVDGNADRQSLGPFWFTVE